MASGRPRGAVRRHHHRRQRPLGAAARRCPSSTATRRAPTSSRRGCATPSSLGIRELTVYSFSTENWSRPAEEVTALMRMFSERILGETPELKGEGVRMRFIGRRERVAPAPARADGLGRGRDRRQRPHHALRRLQLRRAGRDPRRGRALRRRRRGGVPARCSTRRRCTTPTSSSARAASSGCRTTCCGSRPTRELRLPRRAVARLLARGVRGRAGRVRAPPPPLRGALMATRRVTRASRAARDAAQRRPDARRGSSSPSRPSRSRSSSSPRGASSSRPACGLLGLRLPARAVRRCTPQTRPARLAGFAGLLGLLAAAHWGDTGTVLLAFVASLPLVFAVCAAPAAPRRHARACASLTMLGLAWIGLALAHAVLLRDAPHGDGIVIDVLVGDVHRRHAAPTSAAALRAPPAGAVDLARTRRRGPGHRHRRGGRRRVVRRALPGLALGRRTRSSSAPRSPGGPDRATSSSPSSSATRASRTPGRCSAPTAARWTASTPCCSRWSPASTSGRR